MTEYFSVVIPAKHALACCKAGAGILLVGSGRTLHMNCGAVPCTRESKGMCNVRPDPTNTPE